MTYLKRRRYLFFLFGLNLVCCSGNVRKNTQTVSDVLEVVCPLIGSLAKSRAVKQLPPNTVKVCADIETLSLDVSSGLGGEGGGP